MQRQTQGSLLIVGAIGSAIFLVSFVAMMVLADYAFSPALFLSAAVALVAMLVLFIGFHEKPSAPVAAKPVAHVTPTTPTPEPAPAPAAPVTEHVMASEPPPVDDALTDDASSVAAKPMTLEAPDGDADDLKLIKGVGPKLEQLLNSMGFYHFNQLAAWGPDEVAWVDDNLEGFKGRVSRDDWVAQAKTLANGGETEFSKAQS